MKVFLLLCFVAGLLTGCNATYTVQVNAPYCPASDSAKAKADSVSALCRVPVDTVTR